MENYRSNSNKSKQEERKKVEKVVSGAAQKGTGGKGGFFKSTVESVGQYLLHEILVPALKKTKAAARRAAAFTAEVICGFPSGCGFAGPACCRGCSAAGSDSDCGCSAGPACFHDSAYCSNLLS